MDAGIRVRIQRDVERYPHFVVPEGAEGTVTQADEELIAVELDERIDGAEEWDNKVQWYEGMSTDKGFRELFKEDIRVID